MRAVRTQSPLCGLRAGQIDLVYSQLSSINVKAVVRSKFTDSCRSTATVFINRLPIFFLCFTFARICFILTIENGFQNDAGLRESIVRKQALIRQEIEHIFLVQFL